MIYQQFIDTYCRFLAGRQSLFYDRVEDRYNRNDF